MDDPVEDVKNRARRLQRQATSEDPEALEWLRTLPELEPLETATLIAKLQRRHCLATIARRLGFRGWPHAKAALSGDAVDDHGTWMHADEGGAHWHVWSARYEEAKEIRAEHGGFLLPYRRQFYIADEHYLPLLGLDPEDEDWARIGRDFVRPADPSAWRRLAVHRVAGALGA